MNALIAEINPKPNNKRETRLTQFHPSKFQLSAIPCRELLVDSHQMPILEARDLNTPLSHLIPMVRPFPSLPSSSPQGCVTIFLMC